MNSTYTISEEDFVAMWDISLPSEELVGSQQPMFDICGMIVYAASVATCQDTFIDRLTRFDSISKSADNHSTQNPLNALSQENPSKIVDESEIKEDNLSGESRVEEDSPSNDITVEEGIPAKEITPEKATPMDNIIVAQVDPVDCSTATETNSNTQIKATTIPITTALASLKILIEESTNKKNNKTTKLRHRATKKARPPTGWEKKQQRRRYRNMVRTNRAT
ncbi:MAG: hypothetical protein QS748_07145 [Candidatus Endonucleobacter bathymodioli]|uniref:Uncharacterized protein n=1 Tax=Candidatus Endonucleibacter bathymodioli TaxID=539814 RepID=A0AA90NYB7_9GAMM|nr:hypothetical protein [Candidatus Endonucleobacter bathymodioli]